MVGAPEPGVFLFFPFSKMRFMFLLFQLVWTSPDHHDLKNYGSGLAISSTSSLRSCGCISSGPLDLCTFSILNWSQIWSFPRVDDSSFSHSLPAFAFPGVAWSLACEDWGKTVVAYLSLLLVPSNQFSHASTLNYKNKHMKKPHPNDEPLALQGYLSLLVTPSV